MFMPTVGFLRSIAFDNKCPVCGKYYWGAMESENVGTCGRCLSAAFTVSLSNEPEVQKPSSRKSSLISS